jgi:hypothetical protein
MTNLSRAMIYCIISISTISFAFADKCDPNAILRQNVTSYQSNVAVWMSLVSNLTKSSQDSSSQSFGISYAGVGLTYGDAKSLSEYISQQKNYTVSEQQSVSILRSTLSPDSVKAYIACLGSNKGLAIVIPDAALNEDAFQFTVDWNPNYRPRGDVLELKVTNGKIDGKSSVHVQYPASVPFSITRDVSKTLFISATIDSQSDIVSLPHRPSFTMKLREKYEPPLDKPEFYSIEDAGHSLQPLKASLCVSASPDSILIPSTMIPQFLISGDRPRATVNEDKKNSGLKSCGIVYNSTPCKECSMQIRGRFSIFEAYLTDADNKTPPEKVDASRSTGIQSIVKGAATGK